VVGWLAGWLRLAAAEEMQRQACAADEGCTGKWLVAAAACSICSALQQSPLPACIGGSGCQPASVPARLPASQPTSQQASPRSVVESATASVAPKKASVLSEWKPGRRTLNLPAAAASNRCQMAARAGSRLIG